MKELLDENEKLYRAIKRSKPGWLDHGKPTSAMFKDDDGVSVDRGDGRNLSEVIDFMETGKFGKRLKGVCCLNVKECICEPVNAYVCKDATEGNPYHALIFSNEKKEGLSSIQALQLADLCELVYFNEEMEWVNV